MLKKESICIILLLGVGTERGKLGLVRSNKKANLSLFCSLALFLVIKEDSCHREAVAQYIQLQEATVVMF